MREVIATGKTVEEATENACAELGLSRDQVSVEILEMPVKKLFKSTPARVKVSVEGEEEPETRSAEAEKPAAKPIEKPAVQQAKTQPQPSAKPAAAAPPAPAAQAAPAPGGSNNEHKEAVLEKEPEVEIDLATNEAAKRAVDYLASVFSSMGADDIKITAFQQGDATLLRVEGEQISDKLDTRGETIQALSYLTDRTVNRGVDKKDENYLRVRLDVAGYRNRRERELISLAERTGREVAQTKRSRTLAPMNPYERLIIHTRISEMEGVISESTGSDTERRVVVKSTAPDAKDGEDWHGGNNNRRGGGGRGGRPGGGNRGGGNNRRGGGGRGGRDNRDGGRDGGRDRRDRDRGGYNDKPRSNTPEREYADKTRDENAEPVVPQRRDAVKDGDDLPLYGKIEL